MGITDKELEIVVLALNQAIDNTNYFIESYIDGDEAGIRRNLEVQNIMYCAMCEFTDFVRLAKKIDSYFLFKGDKRINHKLVVDWECQLHHLHSVINSIQSGETKRKTRRS